MLHTFDPAGDKAYSVKYDTYRQLPDGSYKLDNGQTFLIKDGYIDDLGFFKDGQLLKENRD